ncbi:rab-GTPase-TBC domain-domain-containing protein [Leucosporidium creatinivorum]|uniref:Rab-GTPase-TBC domain-domain-containing protein n=1 Tax=Leucosporidium creatinivorum TaxID=106004 RepID=A0A1Y2FW12_9BASI|nr:rab-GTPase-TBC domain-domain-containing protein [Leucosporidium creatinivorum]
MAFTTSVENVLSAYLNRNTSVEYHPGLVQLVAPFVWTLKTEAGMYFCFERLMSLYEDYTATHPLSVRMSFFLSLFRQFLPDLHTYFEEEAVDMRELASAWLEGLFAKEMQIGMLMRLWDVYFSTADPLDFHPYVCLAILTTCKESLEELDQSEVRSMLLSLPLMDVDRLVVEAHNLKLAYQHSQTRGERPADY